MWFCGFCGKIMDLHTNTKNANFIRSDDASYEDVRCDFGMSNGPNWSPWKSQEHPCDFGQHLVNICWPHCWLKSVQIWRLLMYLRTWSSSGWFLMTNIFLGSESMEHQLSNALSTMFLRHLVTFLHFETYAFSNPQKKVLPNRSGVELDFLPHIYTGLLNNCP